MGKKFVAALIAAAGFAAAGFAAYKLTTDEELRNKLTSGAKNLYSTSKKKADVMSEEVVVRTAQVTRNPKVNQDWVSKQWDAAI